MINTNDLRRKVNSTDIVDHIDLHANINPILSELIDRIEAAEKERDALRAKVDAMERQEPVAWARKLAMGLPSFGCVTDLKYRPSNMPESAYMQLYALPGAQPAPSVPDALEVDGMYGQSHQYASGWNDCRAAMLAAAQGEEK